MEHVAYSAGTIDYLFSPQLTDEDRQSNLVGNSIRVEESVWTHFLILNTAHPPFDNLRFSGFGGSVFRNVWLDERVPKRSLP